MMKWINSLLEESASEYDLISHIKKLIDINGLTHYRFYTRTYGMIIEEAYDKDDAYFKIEDTKYKIKITSTRGYTSGGSYGYKFKSLEVRHGDTLLLSTDDDSIIYKILEWYGEKKKKMDAEEAQKREQLIKALIIEDTKKYINQSKFDEFDYVLEKRRRLDEITKEAQAIATEFSLVK